MTEPIVHNAEVQRLRELLKELYELIEHNNPYLLTTGHNDRLRAALAQTAPGEPEWNVQHD